MVNIEKEELTTLLIENKKEEKAPNPWSKLFRFLVILVIANGLTFVVYEAYLNLSKPNSKDIVIENENENTINKDSAKQGKTKRKTTLDEPENKQLVSESEQINKLNEQYEILKNKLNNSKSSSSNDDDKLKEITERLAKLDKENKILNKKLKETHSTKTNERVNPTQVNPTTPSTSHNTQQKQEGENDEPDESKTYQAKLGEGVWGIAKKFDVEEEWLARVNDLPPIMKNGKKDWLVKAGQILIVGKKN